MLRTEHTVARVVLVPVAVQKPALGFHPLIQSGARIWRQNVERGSLNSLSNGPRYRPVKDGRVVVIHAKDKTSVNHDSQIAQTFDRRVVIAANVLDFALFVKVFAVGCLEADEEAA